MSGPLGALGAKAFVGTLGRTLTLALRVGDSSHEIPLATCERDYVRRVWLALLVMAAEERRRAFALS